MGKIVEVGAYIKLLEILLDMNKLKKYLKFKKSYSKFNKYIKSYEFCLLFCIDRIFNIIIDEPGIFDLQPDLLVVRARQNRVIRAKFPRKTELGVLLSNIQGLCDKIIKSKNEIELNKVLPKVTEYLIDPINSILSDNYEIDKKYQKQSKKELLKNVARFYFYIYFNDIGKIRISFNHTFLKDKTFFVQGISIPLKLNEQLFFEGYKKIVDFVWQNLLGKPHYKSNIFVKMVESRTWKKFDSFFNIIRDNLIFPLEKQEEVIDPFSKSIFWKKGKISNKQIQYLTKKQLYPFKFKLSFKEKLDEVFYWYPIRVIGSGLSVNNSTGFISLLLGLIKSKRENIKILKIKHKYPYEYVYSFAILMEGYSIFADYSQWYLFLEFCSEGGGIEGQAYDEVMKYLKKYKSKIDLKEYDLPPKSLDSYAADNLAKEAIKSIRELEEYKSFSRGIIFELFMSYLFDSIGYKTRWALKKDFTDKKEIDLLVYKEYKNCYKFIVAEVSTGSQDIINEIKTKIEILRRNKNPLLNYLKLKKSKKCIFQGKLVTIKKSKIKGTKLIEVLDEKKLIALSKKADINFNAIKRLLTDEKKKVSTDELIRHFDMNLYMNK